MNGNAKVIESWWVRQRSRLQVQQVSCQVPAELCYSGKLSLGQLRNQSLGDLPNSRSKSIAGKLSSTLFGQAPFFPPLNILSPVFPMTLCCAALQRRQAVLGTSWPYPCRLLWKLPLMISWLTWIPPQYSL